MKTSFRDLKLQQIDTILTCWRLAELPARPSAGWIKTIREALGMPASYLAKRLNIVPSTLKRLEDSEKDNTITLGSLQRIADELDCELRYALIPRKKIADTLKERATSIAREQMESITHTMSLEAQGTSDETTEEQTNQLAKEFLAGSRGNLWR